MTLPRSQISIVSSIIFLYLDYCCLLLLDITAELKQTLQRALKFFVWFIFKLRRSEHITEFFIKLNWLKVCGRRFYFLGCLIYRIRLSHVSPYLFSKLETVIRLHNYIRRKTIIYRVPFAQLESFRRSFSCIAPKFWNKLLSDVSSAPSFFIFKKH